MTLLLNTLTNVINQIAKSVQLATLVPASLLVLCNLILLLPPLGLDIADVAESMFQVSLIVLAIVTISYLLWLLNGPLIKLLEGYTFEDTWLGREMIRRKNDRFATLDTNLKRCQDHLGRADEWLEKILPLRHPGSSRQSIQNDPECQKLCSLREQWLRAQSRYLEERVNHYPYVPERILPTRLGNTIAAFEHYPYLRYGIDGQAVWPRLIPFLDKNGFVAYVEKEKSAFDFLLNLTAVTVFLGLECLGLSCLLLEPQWLLGCVIAVPLVALAYSTLVTNAVYWGDMTKVAFDLYRHDLRKALLVRQPQSLDDEREQWKIISAFLAINEKPPSIMLDYTLIEKRESEDKKEPGKEDTRNV